MKYFRNRDEVGDAIKVSLPKDFEFRVLGKLITDLENQALRTDFVPEIRKALEHDFDCARRLVRSRDVVGAARLGDALCTQRMLLKRIVSCNTDAQAFAISYQLGAFLKKYPFKGVDTRSPAVKDFIRAEQTCKLFNNENYKSLLRMDATGDTLFGGCLAEIQKDIEELLGSFPDIDRVEEYAGHGPGTSLGPEYKQGKTTSYYKWSNLPYSVTTAAVPFAKRAILADPRWIGALDDWYRERANNRFRPIDMNDFWSRILKIVDGSRIATVPKSGATDRTIAIEPLLNVYLQLGVDRIFKKALKKLWNYDLLDQTVNQKLAELGAIDGEYATIDLKAASDTISLKICELFLPPAWYDFLLDLRSPKGVLNGLTGSFDKISSMGNGYTFALETIIFGAIVRHVMRRFKNRGITSVYGDDIIVPTEVASAVISLLNMCGFAVNNEKTFVDGPFRESCGSDWFLRYNVRPVFLKRPVKTVMDLYYLHNRLYKKEADSDWTWETHFKETRAYVRRYIPNKFGYIFGPPSESLDTYLFSDWKLPGVANQHWHHVLTPRAKIYNNNTSFLFRKLMVPLKASQPIHRWDKSRLLTGSNAFDVTRRDSVQVNCTKKRVWF